MATIARVAELVGAPQTTASYEIARVSSIDAATPVALVFATDAATLEAALNWPAGCGAACATFTSGRPSSDCSNICWSGPAAFLARQLLDGVWGQSVEIDERTVDVHVGRLRKALSRGRERDPSAPFAEPAIRSTRPSASL